MTAFGYGSFFRRADTEDLVMAVHALVTGLVMDCPGKDDFPKGAAFIFDPLAG
jgi:hypothetical protein